LIFISVTFGYFRYGKNSVGYKNYLHHVPKEARISKNERHPTTPNGRKGSKRAFAGTLNVWRKALHLWDGEGPFSEEDKQVDTATAATAANEAEGAAFAEKKMNMFERPLRSKSWADMADSDDSDSDEDEDQLMKPPSPEFQGLRTKRKATEELMPSRMEKRANKTDVEVVEGVGNVVAAGGSKPMSRALQLAKERSAARKNF
jgi:hypothetical protein